MFLLRFAARRFRGLVFHAHRAQRPELRPVPGPFTSAGIPPRPVSAPTGRRSRRDQRGPAGLPRTGAPCHALPAPAGSVRRDALSAARRGNRCRFSASAAQARTDNPEYRPCHAVHTLCHGARSRSIQNQAPALQIQNLLSTVAIEIMRSERAGSQVDVGDGLGKVPVGANRQQEAIRLNFRYNLFVMLKSPNAISTLSVSWSIINSSLR